MTSISTRFKVVLSIFTMFSCIGCTQEHVVLPRLERSVALSDWLDANIIVIGRVSAVSVSSDNVLAEQDNCTLSLRQVTIEVESVIKGSLSAAKPMKVEHYDVDRCRMSGAIRIDPIDVGQRRVLFVDRVRSGGLRLREDVPPSTIDLGAAAPCVFSDNLKSIDERFIAATIAALSCNKDLRVRPMVENKLVNILPRFFGVARAVLAIRDGVVVDEGDSALRKLVLLCELDPYDRACQASLPDEGPEREAITAAVSRGKASWQSALMVSDPEVWVIRRIAFPVSPTQQVALTDMRFFLDHVVRSGSAKEADAARDGLLLIGRAFGR